jgi:hypothetical protein
MESENNVKEFVFWISKELKKDISIIAVNSDMEFNEYIVNELEKVGTKIDEMIVYASVKGKNNCRIRIQIPKNIQDDLEKQSRKFNISKSLYVRTLFYVIVKNFNK